MNEAAGHAHTSTDAVPLRWGVMSLAAASVALGLKLWAWSVSDSSVLLADAAESAIDLLTASLMLASLHISNQPADDRHPWGHGKAEYFSAGVQGALITVTGLGLVVGAGINIARGGHHSLALEAGLIWSTLATASNLAIAIALIRAGRRFNSPALLADGHHNLSDVWTTLAAWLGLGLASVSGWWVLDPIFASLVGLNILRTGVLVARESIDGLMDVTLPTPELDSLEQIIRRRMHPALEFHDLRARRSSQRVFVEFHLVFDSRISVGDSHEVCDQIEAEIESYFAPCEVLIHVEPDSELHDEDLSQDQQSPSAPD